MADTKADHKDILAQARSDYDRAYEREKRNIELAYEDLEFLAAEDYAQWPEQQLKDREGEGRPVLQVNRLPQFVHQITGDIRQMRPSIKVVPVDDGADEKIAELRQGLIRYVENRSDAQAIYFRAADSQVACGIGHWRVQTEYADGSTFNQEIRIGPVEDGVSVLWDPDAVLPTKEDSGFCFVPVDMSRKAFEAKYPNVTPSEFDDAAWPHNSSWRTDDYVRVAEYWVKKPTKKLLALKLDGSIADLTDAPEADIAKYRAQGARIEKRDSTKVCRYLVTAGTVLEGPEEWPGRFIPIVPVIGEEIRIGRRLIRKGIVRDAKDPQRMVNYFESAHTETVGLQPKAPFMVTETNVAKYQSLWEQANTKNLPYLVFEPDQKNGGQAPQRIQPPVSSQGINDGLMRAHENLKGVIGIYDANLGAKSNETSGKAIEARQREGDVGSYVYIDNFSRAVRQTGNIINDLIPFVYDAERTIRIMGEDGKIDVLEVNKANGIDPSTGETVFTHDLTSGAYDVVAQIGPSYSTKRQEARDGMVEFVRAAPEAGALILDLLAKAQDWPMADDISKRIRATLPPKIIKIEEMAKQGASPEQIDQFLTQEQQPPPDPKIIKIEADAQAKQADQQMKAEQAQADFMLEMRRMTEESQARQEQLMADMQKVVLDVRSKIEIAQINAGVGMHKTIVDAENAAMDRDSHAQMAADERSSREALEAHKIDTAAQTARYAADNRPQPDNRAS
jgi:hypothetical protein